MFNFLKIAILIFFATNAFGYQKTKTLVTIDNPTSAFGVLATQNPHPLGQYHFATNVIRAKQWNTFTTNLGSVSASSGLAVIGSGAAANSSAYIQSKIPVTYFPGVGAEFLFTTKLSTCIAGNIQEVGAGTLANAITIGCNGTNFGMFHRHPQRAFKAITSITRTTNTATVTTTATHGLTTGDYVEIVGDSTTEEEYIGTFNITVIGASTFTYPVSGTPTTPATGSLNADLIINTFIDKSAFSHDKLDGNGTSGMVIDVTKLNVFRCQYQYLGGGAISCFVENPKTGSLNSLHTIEYANANTFPSLRDPTLPLLIRSENTTNITDIITSSASMAGFAEGIINEDLGVDFSFSNDKSGITTETNLLTIRNKGAYAGYTNQVRVDMRNVVFSSDGTGNNVVTFTVTKNTTLGGTPAYVDTDTNESVTQSDTAGTTITGGEIVSKFSLTRNSSANQDIDLTLSPNDTVTFSCSSASTVLCSVSVNTKDKF